MDESEVRVRAGDVCWFSIGCTTCRSETPLNGRAERDPAEVIMCLNCGMPLAGANTVMAAYRTYLTELEAASLPVYLLVGPRD